MRRTPTLKSTLEDCAKFDFNEDITREVLWNEAYLLGRSRWYWGPMWMSGVIGRLRTIISSALAFAVTMVSVQSKEPIHPNKIENPQAITAPAMLGMLVLTVAAAGVYVVVKCSSTLPDDKSPVTVVLEKSDDHAHWTPIATNTVVLSGITPIQAFSEEMRNGSSFYRGRVVR